MVRNMNKFSKNPKRKTNIDKLGSKKVKKDFSLEDDEESLNLNEEVKHVEEENSDGDEQLSVIEESDNSEDGLDEGIQHKKSLKKLQETDPEFYKFLQENDRKLLQFDVSDSESGESDNDDDNVHTLPDDLEVDSDDEDFQEERSSQGDDNVVTLALVNSWREKLTEDPSVEVISDAVKGFHAALDRVTGEETSVLKVDGSGVFNAVVELCVMHLQPAVVKVLKLNKKNLKNPDKSKKWVKVKSILHSYFTDLLKLLSGVASEHIVSVLLKHLHTACPFIACYGKLSKVAVKQLTKLWSTGEESIRVLSFLCILRLCMSQKSGLLNTSLKFLYIAYIRSSKFVSVNTLPEISFMRRSLANLFTLNPTLSYQHAFLYIRQLAIHLRNAVTIHKKESFQSVYNWQYMQSLRLWVELLCSAKESTELQQLLYPLVQIIIGCIKLIPTGQYMPLRFHCIELLVKLGRETDVYIPVLPFIMESLSRVDLNKQNKKISMKPFDFTCVLRLSKAAMVENGFPDAIVENVYNLLVEATASYSHSIAFPDIVVPAVIQLKSFIKDCSVSKYSTKLKQILSKVEENAKFINNERNKMNIMLSEKEKIKAFESRMLTQGTPLMKFWEQWSKVNRLQKAKRDSAKNKTSEVYLPVKKSENKKVKTNYGEPVVLLPSDDDSETEYFGDLEEPKPKQKKSKEKLNMSAQEKEVEESDNESEYTDVEDTVADLDLNDF